MQTRSAARDKKSVVFLQTGTANKPTDKNRLKKEKNEAELVVQREAVGSVRKVGRGSKQGA